MEIIDDLKDLKEWPKTRIENTDFLITLLSKLSSNSGIRELTTSISSKKTPKA